MLQVLAATNNAHKVEEFRSILGDVPFEIVQPSSFDDFPEIVEDGLTFEENACIKAVESSTFTGLPSFSDDSGLVVDALDGRPGIYSARYAGVDATNDERMDKLLGELEGIEDRSAKFVCVIAIASEGEIISTFRGEVPGRIAFEKSGSKGFGYDPIFIPDGYEVSFADLGSDVKDSISHRGRAMELAQKFIADELDNFQKLS